MQIFLQRPKAMMRWGDKAKNDDHYLLLESQKEFKKDSRRVAIKGFPDGTPKGQIEELLRSYDIETIHMDKNGTSCKVVFADEQEAKMCIAEIEVHGIRRGWRLEGKNTASDFMICVSHFPLEWDENEFKRLIKDYGETEKCFLVRSKFLDNKSMGYGFLEFTSKSSAIIARNELHGKQVGYDGKSYRIQVHWIDRIPEEYDELQSCTVYCQLPEEWQITSSLSEQLREFMSVFDLVYFDIAHLSNEYRYRSAASSKTIIAIAEYDTPEQAAMTVKQLRATPFPRFGEPLQIMFSLPQYGAPVLLKSFEIFHNEFLMEKMKHGLKDSLLSTPPEAEIQRFRPSSPKQLQLQDFDRILQTRFLQQQQRQLQQQIQISNNQKVLEAAQLAAQVQGLTSGQIQASQNNTGNNFDVTTRQLLQHQLSTLNQNQPNQLQRQQHLVQQPSAVDLDKFKRFSNGFDQVRFGSSGSFAPEQRYHQQQQMQEKPKLDLLSEQFSNQKLSQKLFNPPNPYSSSQDLVLQREREYRIQRQMKEQNRMRDVSYELEASLELKRLDFESRKQMLRRTTESRSGYAHFRHHSLDSMPSSMSSSDQFTPDFYQTPRRNGIRAQMEIDTKDSPKSTHLLGAGFVKDLDDSNSPQRPPWSTQDNETPSKELAKSMSILGRDWTPPDKYYSSDTRRFMNNFSEYDKVYSYPYNSNQVIANKLG